MLPMLGHRIVSPYAVAYLERILRLVLRLTNISIEQSGLQKLTMLVSYPCSVFTLAKSDC